MRPLFYDIRQANSTLEMSSERFGNVSASCKHNPTPVGIDETHGSSRYSISSSVKFLSDEIDASRRSDFIGIMYL